MSLHNAQLHRSCFSDVRKSNEQIERNGRVCMKDSLYDACLTRLDDTLLRQWHPKRNGDLTPKDISVGSHQKVWWRCDKGHEWQALVKSRVCGSGCPVCTNRRIRLGENDLAATHPDIARQWHPIKNGDLLPCDVTAGSRRKVWWTCDKGHEWQATVTSRTNHTGCPVCAGKRIIPGENDMASAYPELAAQWHPTKNGLLRPDGVSVCSNRRVWWKCPLGHEYVAPVSHRTTRGDSCPYCGGRRVLAGFNDLATLEPKIAAQWHPELNAPLTPDMVGVGAKRKVWWQCGEGHVWKSMIYSRTGKMRCGCPVCAGRTRMLRTRRYGIDSIQPRA